MKFESHLKIVFTEGRKEKSNPHNIAAFSEIWITWEYQQDAPRKQGLQVGRRKRRKQGKKNHDAYFKAQ